MGTTTCCTTDDRQGHPRSVTKSNKNLYLSFSSNIRNLRRENLKFLKKIKEATFGNIYQVQEKETGDIYATKIIKRDTIECLSLTTSQSFEYLVISPFVAQNICIIQQQTNIISISAYIEDFTLHKQLTSKVLDEEQACSILAEVVLGLSQFHKNDIVYRNLNTSRIIIHNKHAKLSNFGIYSLVQWPTQRMNSFSEMLEFRSPEQISMDKVTQQSDLWQLGICLYEMLTGRTPFYKDNSALIEQAILSQDPVYPPDMSKEAQDLISKLLKKNQALRLGAKRGIASIKRHPFFSSVIWKQVEEVGLIEAD